MENGLDGGDAGDPAVEQEECRVAPVGEPEQDVVSARVQDEEGYVGKADDAHAVGEQRHDLFALHVRVPGIWLR